MSKTSGRRKLLAAVLLAMLLIGACWVVPRWSRSSNCGGNSAALAACRSVVVCLELINAERGGAPVSVTSLSPQERDYFRQIAGLSWLHDSRVLVTTSAVRIATGQPSNIIAVCDRAFDNVPRPFWGRAPRSHAVGYANGHTGLLSPAEFQRLDLSRFIDVKSIPEKTHNASTPPAEKRPVRLSP